MEKQYLEIRSNGATAELVEIETGEVVSTYDPETHKVVSKKQSEAGRSYFKKINDKRHFSFSNMELMIDVIRSLTPTQCGYLLILQCHMQFETGLLVKRVKEDGEFTEVPMDKEDIMHLLTVKRRAFFNLFSALKKHGIVTEDKIGKIKAYKINQKIHFRNFIEETEGKDHRLVKTYFTTFKQLANNLKPNEIGFIYKLLPWVHFKTNTICADPFVNDETEVRYLTNTKMGSVIGVDTRTVKTMLKKLLNTNPRALTQLNIGNGVYYKLNPWIFYRQIGEPDASLKEMFTIKPHK